jgi:hypothetical protein
VAIEQEVEVELVEDLRLLVPRPVAGVLDDREATVGDQAGDAPPLADRPDGSFVVQMTSASASMDRRSSSPSMLRLPVSGSCRDDAD